MAKKFEMTGSPKNAGIEKKQVIIDKMSKFGWEQCKMSKKNNQCEILLAETKDSGSAKIKLATELGLEIMTYDEIVELFDLLNDNS